MFVEYFMWFKAFHIVAMVAWMCGMLYLPRLFVYHCQVAKGSEASELFKVMERKLLKLIMNPAMIMTWILGLYLAWVSDAFQPVNVWFHVKLTLVLALSGLHGFYSKCQKNFAKDANTKSEKFYRIINEVPAVLLILIVVMVVVRPV